MEYEFKRPITDTVLQSNLTFWFTLVNTETNRPIRHALHSTSGARRLNEFNTAHGMALCWVAVRQVIKLALLNGDQV